MSDLFDKVTEQQDIIRKLLSYIPGFKGYIERENRRSADKELRKTIAKKFEAIWQRISAVQRDLIANGRLDLIDDLEPSAIKFRQLIDRVERASYGYSGFFDAVKINEKELTAVYQYDLTLFTLADDANRAVDNLEASLATDGLPAAIRNLVSVAGNCVSVFEQRNEVISGTQSPQ
jgi:hypothetical protein